MPKIISNLSKKIQRPNHLINPLKSIHFLSKKFLLLFPKFLFTANVYAGSCSSSTSDCIAGTKCLTPIIISNANTLCLCEDRKYATDDSECVPCEYFKLAATESYYIKII